VRNEASFNILSCLVEELGAYVDQQCHNGFTALSVAAYMGHHGTVRYLAVELGADINIPNKKGKTPLWGAAANDHLAVVRLLLTLRADINPGHINGVTPLMARAINSNEEIVKWLVKAGADTQCKFRHKCYSS
jgi:ankyrin repeat protein